MKAPNWLLGSHGEIVANLATEYEYEYYTIIIT